MCATVLRGSPFLIKFFAMSMRSASRPVLTPYMDDFFNFGKRVALFEEIIDCRVRGVVVGLIGGVGKMASLHFDHVVAALFILNKEVGNRDLFHKGTCLVFWIFDGKNFNFWVADAVKEGREKVVNDVEVGPIFEQKFDSVVKAD